MLVGVLMPSRFGILWLQFLIHLVCWRRGIGRPDDSVKNVSAMSNVTGSTAGDTWEMRNMASISATSLSLVVLSWLSSPWCRKAAQCCI